MTGRGLRRVLRAATSARLSEQEAVRIRKKAKRRDPRRRPIRVLPDGEGLHEAVDRLIEADGPFDDPPVPQGEAIGLPPYLPEQGLGERAALKRLARPVLSSAARLGDAGFLAHMDPPTPWITWAAAMWAASRNQNLLHPDTSPTGRELERVAVRWLSPWFSMDGGHMVPGSSVANLTALWVARDLRGAREVVCSEMAHLSIRKAARILGLDLRLVPADEAHRLDPALLGNLSRSALVLTAGTVASGAIDPLRGRHRAAWVHVDAAWAGPLRLSELYQELLEGVQHADSVSFSGHKWLFQPKEAALILFQNSAAAHEAIAFGGGYLAVPNVGVLGSHGASALPLVATLLAWGREGLAARLGHCMGLAADLANIISSDARLELFRQPTTGVVLWHPRATAELEAVRAQMRSSFVSITEISGQRWFRSVAANPMADPASVVDDALSAVASLR